MLSPSLSGGWYELQLCEGLHAIGVNVELHTGPHVFRVAGSAYAPPYPLRVRFGRRTQLASYRPGPFRAAWRGFRLAGHVFSMLRFAREARAADLVHLHFLTVPSFDLAVLRRIAARTPIVTTVHNVYPHDRARTPHLMACNRALFELSRELFVHSEASADRLRRDFGVPSSRVTVIPMGRYTRHAPVPPVRQVPPRVLMFGEIRANKGLDSLIAACARLAAAGRAASLRVAGRCGARAAARYRSRARAAGLTTFELTDTFVPEDTIPAEFAAAAVVALPYTDIEQSAVAVLAHTLGRPMVGSDVGGLGSLLRESGAGLLVPPGDVDALADALGTLLDDRQLAERLGAAGRQYAERALGWDRIGEATRAAYARALRSWRAAIPGSDARTSGAKVDDS